MRQNRNDALLTLAKLVRVSFLYSARNLRRFALAQIYGMLGS